MRFFKSLFVETCPQCNKELETHDSNIIKGIIIKSCPDDHYQKEFHPAFETYIETHKSFQ
jgi:hypothetical protein